MSHSANPLCFETLLAKTQIKNHKTFYLEDKNIYSCHSNTKYTYNLHTSTFLFLSLFFIATFLRYSLSEILKISLDGSMHFVKCFKPNNENTKSNELCKEYLKNQLVYSGIQEAVKSRKNGFPIRLTFVDFLTR